MFLCLHITNNIDMKAQKHACFLHLVLTFTLHYIIISVLAGLFGGGTVPLGYLMVPLGCG